MRTILLLLLTISFSLLAAAQKTEKKVPAENIDLITADLYFKEQKHNEAIDYYTKVLSNNPKEKTALYKRAISYFYLKDDAKTIKDLSDLIAIDKNNCGAYYLRAMAKFNINSNAMEDDKKISNESGCDDLFMAKQLEYKTDYENWKILCPNL